MKKIVTEDKIARVNRLAAVATTLNVSVGQLALAWVLRQPNVASALVGASSPQQMDENAAASGVALSSESLEEIEAILAE